MNDKKIQQPSRPDLVRAHSIELLSLTTLIILGHAAGAQAAEADDGALEEVVVTAEHRSESVQQIATPVSLISVTRLRTTRCATRGDVIRFVPNMSADTTDGHGRPKFYIRGIGLSDASIWNINPIGTYNDGVYIWNASTVGFPTFDLERGRGAARSPRARCGARTPRAGPIHFISKEPTFEPEGYVKGSYGRFNESLVEGAYSTPLIEDKLAARVSLFNQEADCMHRIRLAAGTERWATGPAACSCWHTPAH